MPLQKCRIHDQGIFDYLGYGDGRKSIFIEQSRRAYSVPRQVVEASFRNAQRQEPRLKKLAPAQRVNRHKEVMEKLDRVLRALPGREADESGEPS